MSRRPTVLGLLAAGLLLAPACATSDGQPEETRTGAAAGQAPTEDGAAPGEDAAHGPLPVEADGGIGGEGGGPVTSNLILSGEQVEVRDSCLVTEDPPTYRLHLAADGSLTVTAGQGGRLEVELGGTTYASPDDHPPATTVSEGALSAQGRAVSDAGEEHFVDAVIGLDDLPAC